MDCALARDEGHCSYYDHEWVTGLFEGVIARMRASVARGRGGIEMPNDPKPRGQRAVRADRCHGRLHGVKSGTTMTSDTRWRGSRGRAWYQRPVRECTYHDDQHNDLATLKQEPGYVQSARELDPIKKLRTSQ